MRDSSKGSRRSLWPTPRHQELENLLQQFPSLQIDGEDSLLLQPVSPHNAHHNRSDLPEVSELELSYSPDCECDPSATGHSDWLSARRSHSLAPELANTQLPESEELSTIQTPSSNLDQENLPDEANLSDFIPGVYIHSTPRQRSGASNPTSQFSSPLSPLTPSPPSSTSSSSLSSESTPPLLSFLLDCSTSTLQPTPHLQDRFLTQAPAPLVAIPSSGLSSVPPLLTAPPFSHPPNQQPPAVPV